MLKERIKFLVFFCLVLSSCNGNLDIYNAANRFNTPKYRQNSEYGKVNANKSQVVKIKEEPKVYMNKKEVASTCGSGYYKVGNPYTVMRKTYYPREYKEYKESGLASWYGEGFHNKQTANGDIFNMNDLTAAHKTLPLPSIVKVTNLDSGKSIIVRVNDRGPFADGEKRILDLSKRAANEIGFDNRGVLGVMVELLPDETLKYRKKCGLI
jgi:rare lipoprotein A (peptidoglycan hydrolase)